MNSAEGAALVPGDRHVLGGPGPRGASPAATAPAPAWLDFRSPLEAAVPLGAGRPCRCGHDKDAHEHYRRGTDCALCACGRYARPWMQRWRAGGR